jgi:hypothetical protein
MIMWPPRRTRYPDSAFNNPCPAVPAPAGGAVSGDGNTKCFNPKVNTLHLY